MKNIACFILLALSACGGSNGADGTAGVNGLNGTNGANGLTISSELFCSEINAGAGVTLTYTYLTVKYSTGDREVICTVADSSRQYSNTEFYRSTAAGATSGYCPVNYDADASSGGYWAFTLSGANAQGVYNDSPSAHNNYTFVFSCSNL